MRPDVSVLIPTYNGASLLVETVESILDQSYRPAEVIILDDGSTDNTREVVASRFGGKVQYRYTANGGICRARNLAASFATSPFLAFCDHDDLWTKDKLRIQMEIHNSNPDIEYSFTNFAIVKDGVWSEKSKFDEAPASLFPPSFYSGVASFICDRSLYDDIIQYQPIWPSTILMKRTFFEKVGPFTESLGKNPSEDLEFTLRCVRRPPLAIVCQPVVGVRKHPSNYSGNGDKSGYGRIEIFEYVLKHHGVNQATEEIIRTKIASERLDLSYGAFRREDYKECASLLSNVPPSMLSAKDKAKLWLSTNGRPFAGLARTILSKN